MSIALIAISIQSLNKILGAVSEYISKTLKIYTESGTLFMEDNYYIIITRYNMVAPIRYDIKSELSTISVYRLREVARTTYLFFQTQRNSK